MFKVKSLWSLWTTLQSREDFLCDHSQQVVVDGYCNASMLVISGVPQGSVLHGMNMLIGQYTRQIMLEAFCIIVLGIVLLMQ